MGIFDKPLAGVPSTLRGYFVADAWRIQAEAQLANQLQAQEGITRSDALRRAADMLYKVKR